MVFEKLIKKGANVSNVILTTIISIFVFIACFSFMAVNANQAGITVEQQYITANNTVGGVTTTVSSFVDNWRTAGQGITEGNYLTAGYFGLKGIVTVLTMPFQLIGTILTAIKAGDNIVRPVFGSLIMTYLTLVITVIIVVAAITVISNRGREI